MSEYKGIDISAHNSVEWESLKDIDFVIIRAGYGKLISQKDKKFENHYANAKSRGKHVGIYWYSYATTEAEAIQEAKCCLAIIKGYEIDYPVYFDMEESKQRALGKKICSGMIKAFCSEIEKAGYIAGFYTNVDFYTSVIDDEVKKCYTCWIAHWNVSKPAVTAPMWQYGVVNNLDRDIAYTDFSTWLKQEPEHKQSKKIRLFIDDKEYFGEITEV